MDNFGKRLEKARKAAGLSQVDLACKTGLSKSAICNYESGRRKKVSQPVILTLATALGISWQSLMGVELDGTTSEGFNVYLGEQKSAVEDLFGRKTAKETIEELIEEPATITDLGKIDGVPTVVVNPGKDHPSHVWTEEEIKEEINSDLDKLNLKGKKAAMHHIRELTQIPGYTE